MKECGLFYDSILRRSCRLLSGDGTDACIICMEIKSNPELTIEQIENIGEGCKFVEDGTAEQLMKKK